MGKLTRKLSRNTYIDVFDQYQRGGNIYSYPVYRGRLRGGFRMLPALKRFFQGAGEKMKRIAKRSYNVIGRDALKTASEALPGMILGNADLGQIAKKSLPRFSRKLQRIVGNEIFSAPPPRKRAKKVVSRKRKKPVKKQKGGMYTLAYKRKNRKIRKRKNKPTNVFGE